MNNVGLLMEYEDILLGKRKEFSSEYIGKGTSTKDIKEVLLYAYEDLLNWSPKMIRDYNSLALVDGLHLMRILKKVDFPPEINPEEDVFYVASCLYPDKIKCSKKALVLRVYEKVLQGRMAKYPKKFFSDAEGELNFNICLQYAIAQRLQMQSVEELYEYFSNKEKGLQFLKSANLHNAYASYYEYPIDALHESLPSSQQNLLLYMKTRFITELTEMKKEYKNDN